MGLRDIWIKINGKDDSKAALASADKGVTRLGRTAKAMSGTFARSFARIKSGMLKLKTGVPLVGRAFAKSFRFAARSAGVLIGALAAVGGAGVWLVKLGSDADETASKFDAVFRDIRGSANKTAKSLSKDFRITSTEAKRLLGDTADLLTGFGFAQDEALALSDKVQRLGIDLASFTNYSGGAIGASQALTKLLLGETEQAKALGIVVRQGSEEYKNAVKAKMEDLGVTTLQAKAMVALEMATAQSKNAIGDYSRTSHFAANAMRGLKSAITGMLERLGKTIIAGLELGQVMQDWGDALRRFSTSKAFDNITNRLKVWLTDAKTFVEMFAGMKQERGAAISALADVLKASLKVGAEMAVKVLVAAAKGIGAAIGKAARAEFVGKSKAEQKQEREELGSKAIQQRVETVGADQAVRDLESIGIEDAAAKVARAVEILRRESAGVTAAEGQLKDALDKLHNTLVEGAENKATRQSMLPSDIYSTENFGTHGLPSNGYVGTSTPKDVYGLNNRPTPSVTQRPERIGPTLDRVAKATEGMREDLKK